MRAQRLNSVGRNSTEMRPRRTIHQHASKTLMFCALGRSGHLPVHFERRRIREKPAAFSGARAVNLSLLACRVVGVARRRSTPGPPEAPSVHRWPVPYRRRAHQRGSTRKTTIAFQARWTTYEPTPEVASPIFKPDLVSLANFGLERREIAVQKDSPPSLLGYHQPGKG